MRSNKRADCVDIEVLTEIGKFQRQRIIGRIGGAGAAYPVFVSKSGRFKTTRLTIVYNDTGHTQRSLDLRKHLDDRIRVCEITLDVELLCSVVGFGAFPRGQSYLVAFGCEGFGYAAADSGTGTKNENDGDCRRHDTERGRK